MPTETDPLSAAHTYRQALQRIAEAKSLAAAQKHARAALDIVFTPPRGGNVSVVGRFGGNSQQAFVAISVPDLVNQVPAAAAREIAANILSEAAIAEADGALVAFLLAEHMSRGQIGKLMSTLRRFRGQFRSDVSEADRRADEPTSAA
jgi:hypothetical protein